MGRAKDILIKCIPSKIANEFIQKHHYSGKKCNNSQLHFGAFLDGRLHGVMSFGPSMDKRKMMPLVHGTEFNEFTELNRMAFDPFLPRNSESRCLSIVLRLIKKNCPHIKWVITFADATQCGCGTIYRAAGFHLIGIKKNSTMIRLPNGEIAANITYQKSKYILKTGKACSPSGSEKLSGFQIKYIYFIHQNEKKNLSIPILSYSEIDKVGASMYRGKQVMRVSSNSRISPDQGEDGVQDHLHAPLAKEQEAASMSENPKEKTDREKDEDQKKSSSRKCPMVQWHLELVPIKKLKEHPKNPRYISKEDLNRLQDLIEKFGLIDKPVINTDFCIIGGHQRLKVLKRLKMKEVECWVPDQDLSQEDIDRLCISLNKVSGDWDFDILANQWEMTDLLDWGFSEEELLGNFKDVEKIEGSEEDEQEHEPPKDPITKPGDLYILGDHRLLCGDSTLPDDVAKLLDGAEPILMCTDPPYGVNYDASWRDPSKIGSDGIRRKPKSLGKVQNDDKVNWSLAWHLFPGSVAYVWCAPSFLPEVALSLDQVDFERKSIIIWAKQHFALSRGDYHWQHEACWYVVKKGHKHNWQGSRKESTLWEISNMAAMGGDRTQDDKTNHSTQKPIECMARPIRNNSAVGEGVYDPFVGSGTTLIAAEMLGRKCFAIEIDPGYCDVVVERWKKYRIKNGKDDTVQVIRKEQEEQQA